MLISTKPGPNHKMHQVFRVLVTYFLSCVLLLVFLISLPTIISEILSIKKNFYTIIGDSNPQIGILNFNSTHCQPVIVSETARYRIIQPLCKKEFYESQHYKARPNSFVGRLHTKTQQFLNSYILTNNNHFILYANGKLDNILAIVEYKQSSLNTLRHNKNLIKSDLKGISSLYSREISQNRNNHIVLLNKRLKNDLRQKIELYSRDSKTVSRVSKIAFYKP